MSTVWWPTKHRKIFALDVERTDQSINHRLTQIGIMGNVNKHPISFVIDPETDTGKSPLTIPGIEVDLANGREPMVFGHYMDVLYDLMQGATIIVQNHAANGDIASIDNEFRRHGREPPKVDRIIDTLWLMRLVKQPGSKSLSAGCAALNLPLPDPPHNARADAVATWRLWIGLCNRHPDVRVYYFNEEFDGVSSYFLKEESWLDNARIVPLPYTSTPSVP